jgi:Rrf2 family transcriptional regulator, iron-sulfur cluster assembly transcription factor
MKITMAAEYAVRCVLYLTKQGQNVLVSRQEIADSTRTPAEFLAKIAQDLAKAGIITIKQGAKGGYSLHSDPSTVTMLSVVEAIIGEIMLNECTVRPETCPASPGCSANLVWQRARQQARETLRQATFADLARHGSCCVPPPPIPLASERTS